MKKYASNSPDLYFGGKANLKQALAKMYPLKK